MASALEQELVPIHCEEFVIISHVIGGLGNQMFQYAIGRALSLENRQPFMLDISSFNSYRLHQGFELQRVFKGSISVAKPSDVQHILRWQSPQFIKRLLMRPILSGLRGKKFVLEPHFQYWSKVNEVQGDCYFLGYWQSEKYFQKYSATIRQDFIFKQSLVGKNFELASQISQVNAVSLHIRRGDYVNNSKTNSMHGVCSLDYYKMAIKFILNCVENPCFFVFSDDIAWVKQNLKLEATCEYVSHNLGLASHFDMQLMSLCKHHIIANSSFSWWGAWLNVNPDKVVIAPKRWFLADLNTKDLLPTEWIIL